MQEPLSDIIQEMILPYHDGNKEEIDLLVAIAQCAWNKTILPSELSENILNEFLYLFEHDEDIKELIKIFSLEKTINFPKDDRVIIRHEIKKKNGEWKLKVNWFSWSERNKQNDFKFY